MDKKILMQELKLKAVRSSGAGGQHVNKVSTKVELIFDVPASKALSLVEKERIYKKLAARLTKEKILILQADEHRSQYRNKALAIERLFELLEKAVKVPKKRRRTKPTRSSIEKRLTSKKKKALTKIHRGKPKLD